MMEKYLQIEARSVVLIGNFNPLIFQPAWFSQKELIQEEEARSAVIEIIHPEITKFNIGDWLNFEVTVNRCSFTTAKEPYFEPIKDLVFGIFSILRETPISALGINNTFNLLLHNYENNYKFGSTLTPLDIWDQKIKKPRLLRLEIIEEERIDNFRRSISITPSNQKMGISININNDYKIKKIESVLDILSSKWDEHSTEARNIVNDLLRKIFN